MSVGLKIEYLHPRLLAELSLTVSPTSKSNPRWNALSGTMAGPNWFIKIFIMNVYISFHPKYIFTKLAMFQNIACFSPKNIGLLWNSSALVVNQIFEFLSQHQQADIVNWNHSSLSLLVSLNRSMDISFRNILFISNAKMWKLSVSWKNFWMRNSNL